MSWTNPVEESGYQNIVCEADLKLFEFVTFDSHLVLCPIFDPILP